MGNHGTKQTEDSDIERTPEYADFMHELALYHRQRGTHLQREPSLGPRKISLHKLYHKIIGYGGYDKVSDTSLMWRRIADEYHVPPMSNAGMPGYLLKSMYYKNLAAFEIERHWGKKAPPPELLEHLTARGGAILSRPEVLNPGTPRATSSSVSNLKPARATPQPRAPQQQQYHPPPVPQIIVPPPTPVTHSTEYTRPEPVSEYVRPLYPITAGQFTSHSLHDAATNNLQPVVSRKFIDQHKPSDEEYSPKTTVSSLLRATMALKSRLDSEIEWGMKLLIKASYELADDFVLEKIGGLTEVLLVLLHEGIESLSREESEHLADTVEASSRLNGDRKAKRPRLYQDLVETVGSPVVSRALECALILRNITLQQENSKFLLRLPIVSEILRQGLTLSDYGTSLELKQYCMEICDSVVPHMQINSEEDALYLTFVEFLSSDDRNALLLGLRALCRLSIADEHNRLLQDINFPVITRLITLLQANDAELLVALAAFFFQYTTYRLNTAALMRMKGSPLLLRRLLGLTMWNAQERSESIAMPTESKPTVTTTVIKKPPPSDPPQLSEDIIRELLIFQEPERAIHWMRACFEDDKEESVTQILLWQTYRTLFTPYSLPTQNGTVLVSGKPLLQAADVIKMVGNAFTGASAMVTNHPSEGQKFIIKGIKCREYPSAPSGKKYIPCKWVTDDATQATCSAPYATQKDLYNHIVEKHIKAAEGGITCRWAGCGRFGPEGESNQQAVARHIRLHTDAVFNAAQTSSSTKKDQHIDIITQKTVQDDKGEPRGLALTAALTLRNIVRAEPKIFNVAQVKGTVKDDLITFMSLNPAISAQLGEVLACLP